MIWLMSDSHWRHANIILYCSRPFGDVQDLIDLYHQDGRNGVKAKLQVDDDAASRLRSACKEMDEHMFSEVARKARPGDIILHGGDIVLGGTDNVRAVLKRIGVPVFLIRGNHDHKVNKCRDAFLGIADRLEGEGFVMTHRPLRGWRGRGEGKIHLHGHIHEKPLEWAAPDIHNLCPEYQGYPLIDPAVFGLSQDDLGNAIEREVAKGKK